MEYEIQLSLICGVTNSQKQTTKKRRKTHKRAGFEYEEEGFQQRSKTTKTFDEDRVETESVESAPFEGPSTEEGSDMDWHLGMICD